MANELRPCPCGIGDRFDYEASGQEIQVEHIKAHVCKPVSTDRAVIVIHDIFGWQLPNTRYMADMLAANGYIEADAVLKYLKEQCGAKKLGVVGFCWGGVASDDDIPGIEGLIKDSDDISNLLNTTFFIFAEKGNFIPLHQVTLLEEKLKRNCKVHYEVKIYPGQTHGFVHRKREDIDPWDKPYIEEERKDIIDWLNKYV